MKCKLCGQEVKNFIITEAFGRKYCRHDQGKKIPKINLDNEYSSSKGRVERVNKMRAR